MKIAIFGATGGTGKEFLLKCLGMEGSKVSLLVRNPARLPSNIDQNNINIITGDVLNKVDVMKTLENKPDAVFVSLGNTPFAKHANPNHSLCYEGTKNIIEAMKSLNIQRLIIISSFGVGPSYNKMGFMQKFFVNYIIKKAIQDKNNTENWILENVKKEEIQWTFIKPGGLMDGFSGKYNYGPDLAGSRTYRGDVADFALKCIKENIGIHQSLNIFS